MKNTKILLGLVICIITLISCGKEQTTSTICSTCISKPDIIKNIDVFGRNYEADIYIGKNSEKSDIKYRIAIIEPQNTITKDDYINLNLKGILNGKIDINEIVGCVIFTNGDITNFKEIKQEQIIGYLIYINKNNSLYVNSYKKVTEKYELVDDLSMEIGYTSANDIYYYKSFLSKQNNKDDISRYCRKKGYL